MTVARNSRIPIDNAGPENGMPGWQEPNTLGIPTGDISDRIWAPLERTAGDDLLSVVLLIILLFFSATTLPSKYLINSEALRQIVSIA